MTTFCEFFKYGRTIAANSEATTLGKAAETRFRKKFQKNSLISNYQTSNYCMKTVYHPNQERGHYHWEWLNTYHSFNFSSFYRPDRDNFGALRVLNDDVIATNSGFPTHPHQNMEIITLILKGSIAHKDSIGTVSTIEYGEIQAMTAGTGIAHSEFNPSPTTPTELFQIWIFPKKAGLKPAYSQAKFLGQEVKNRFVTLASPTGQEGKISINQDAYISWGEFTEKKEMSLSPQIPGNGSYILVESGSAKLGDQVLGARDAIGVWDTNSFSLTVEKDSRVLWIEVPIEPYGIS